MWRSFYRGQITFGLFGPGIAIVFAGVVAKPYIRVAIGIRTIPVQVVTASLDQLFVGRQYVAIDQAIQLSIGQVIGEI